MKWLKFDEFSTLQTVVTADAPNAEVMRAPYGEERFQIFREPDDLEERIGVATGELCGLARVEGDCIVVLSSDLLRGVFLGRERLRIALEEQSIASQLVSLQWIAEHTEPLPEQVAAGETLLKRWGELDEDRRGLEDMDLPDWVQHIAGKRFALQQEMK